MQMSLYKKGLYWDIILENLKKHLSLIKHALPLG